MNSRQHTMAKFFLELSLVNYSMLAYLPSQVAASALCLARKLLPTDNQHWVRYNNCNVNRKQAKLFLFLNHHYPYQFSLSFLSLSSLISLSLPHLSFLPFYLFLWITNFPFLSYIFVQNSVPSYYGDYTERDLQPCCIQLAIIVKGMHSCKQQAVREKYSNSKFLSIAKEPALSGSIIQELAAQKNTTG